MRFAFQKQLRGSGALAVASTSGRRVAGGPLRRRLCRGMRNQRPGAPSRLWTKSMGMPAADGAGVHWPDSGAPTESSGSRMMKRGTYKGFDEDGLSIIRGTHAGLDAVCERAHARLERDGRDGLAVGARVGALVARAAPARLLLEAAERLEEAPGEDARGRVVAPRLPGDDERDARLVD
jgi:hypothetical protein